MPFLYIATPSLGAKMTAATQKTEPDAGARERLLTAALDLFNEKGYAATSVRELVAAAGVTKPVLYYYFGNKEGIYLELMQNSYGTFESLVQGISLTGSARESIIQFCCGLFDVSVQRLALVRLIYAIHYGPPQGAPAFDLEAYFFRMLELIQQLVRAGIDGGELKPESVEDVSRAIIAILTSAINDLLCQREARLDREGMVRMLHLLMNGVAQG
jgi:TetR/AcrR family transcriptional regulator